MAFPSYWAAKSSGGTSKLQAAVGQLLMLLTADSLLSLICSRDDACSMQTVPLRSRNTIDLFSTIGLIQIRKSTKNSLLGGYHLPASWTSSLFFERIILLTQCRLRFRAPSDCLPLLLCIGRCKRFSHQGRCEWKPMNRVHFSVNVFLILGQFGKA